MCSDKFILYYYYFIFIALKEAKKVKLKTQLIKRTDLANPNWRVCYVLCFKILCL